MTDTMMQTAVQAKAQNSTDIAAAAREQTETQSAIVVAKQFPRDEHAAFLAIKKACERPRFADNALYSFPRGKTTVTGPSVNLAREAARTWGNIRHGFSMIPTEDDDWLHIEGWAHDAQTNAWVKGQDRFRARIQRKVWNDETRQKETVWVEPDERDRRELVNRRAAFLVRNCILQLLPSDLIDEAAMLCVETARKAASGELEQSREATIRALVAAFDGIQVSIEMIEERLGHKVDLIDETELAELRAIWKSIKDGQTNRGDHFSFEGASDGTPMEEPVSDAAAALNRAAEAEATEPEPKLTEPEEPERKDDALFDTTEPQEGH